MREIELDSRIGVTLFAAWVVATIASAAARPGELLEMALIGAAGTAAWLLVQGLRVTATQALLLALSFAIPLLETWPVRVYDSRRTGLDPALWAVTGIPSLLFLVALAFNRDWKRRPSALLSAAAGLAVVAVAASSLAARHPAASAAAGWVELVLPAGLALLLQQTVRTAADAWRYVGAAVMAAGVPAFVGVAAYLLDFGFPTDGRELVVAKATLYRPHLLQQLTFGNVGHLSDFALLLAPVAVVASLRRQRVLTRAAAGLVALGLIGTIVFTLSRSTLLFAAGALFGVAVLLALHSELRGALAPLAACGLIVVVILTPTVERSFAGLLPTDVRPSAAASGGPAEVAGSAAGAARASEEMRLSALRTGWRVARAHAPWGVGTGEYELYDPVHTAPHSLLLQVLAENGVAGVAVLAVLTLVFLVSGVPLLRRGHAGRDGLLLRLGCVAGGLSLLAKGYVAGVALALGPVAVWALLLFLLAGLVGMAESRDA